MDLWDELNDITDDELMNDPFDGDTTADSSFEEDYAREDKAKELKNRMLDLLNEAKENNFDFIDKYYGNMIRPRYIELYDNE